MVIKLHYPPDRFAEIVAAGLAKRNPETLHIVVKAGTEHAGIYRGKSSRGRNRHLLDRATFALLVGSYGAWIETRSDRDTERIRNVYKLREETNERLYHAVRTRTEASPEALTDEV